MSIVWQCRTFYVYYCCYWVFGFWGCRYCCIVPLLHWLRIVICGRETPKLARCYKSVNKWVVLCSFEIDFWRIFIFYICDGNSGDDEGIGEGNAVHLLPWILENGGVLDAISPRLLLAPFVCSKIQVLPTLCSCSHSDQACLHYHRRRILLSSIYLYIFNCSLPITTSLISFYFSF